MAKKIEERLKYCPFNLKVVKKRFGSNDFVGILASPKVNAPLYVFYQSKPDRSKGHTEFFGLVLFNNNLFVTSVHPEELEYYQVQNAVKCMACGDELISLYRHDYQTCSCEKCMIDGGGVYQRFSSSSTETLHFRINTLSLEIVQ